MHKGILTVISGFSGAGKGTVMKLLTEQQPYSLSISATTRGPREGESHGKEYFFLTREEFERMIREDELVEWAEYVGNYYGTPKQYVKDQLDQGRDVILEIEIQGALKIKRQFPDALLLFIATPDGNELKRRLTGRGTESSEVIEKRLRRAAEEAVFMKQYDYIVINDQLQDCVDTIHGIICSAHHGVSHNTGLIEEIEAQLQAYSK